MHAGQGGGLTCPIVASQFVKAAKTWVGTLTHLSHIPGRPAAIYVNDKSLAVIAVPFNEAFTMADTHESVAVLPEATGPQHMGMLQCEKIRFLGIGDKQGAGLAM